jgi:CHAT domain-containing protein
VLSACSSGLTADSRTNSFHGLPGSLFRIGARAIVGSRWPVDDELSARLMGRLHAMLCTSTAPLDTLLADAVRSLGPALPIEDAAAFGVFGLA